MKMNIDQLQSSTLAARGGYPPWEGDIPHGGVIPTMGEGDVHPLAGMSTPPGGHPPPGGDVLLFSFLENANSYILDDIMFKNQTASTILQVITAGFRNAYIISS